MPFDPNAGDGGDSRIPRGLIEEPGFLESLADLDIDAKQYDQAMFIADLALCRNPMRWTVPTLREDIRIFRIDFVHPHALILYVSIETDGVHLHYARWADEW